MTSPVLATRNYIEFLQRAVSGYAIYSLDNDGVVKSANPGAASVEGYSQSEVVGRHFSIFFPQSEVDRGAPNAALECATRDGRFELEGWRVSKNAIPFWASTVLEPIFDQNRSQVGFAIIVKDLSAEQEARGSGERSDQALRLFMDSVVHCGLYAMDAEGFITSWNPGAEYTKGYSRREALGRHFSIFFTAEDVSRGVPSDIIAVARSLGRFEGEGWRVRKDGTRFWAHVVMERIHDPDGRLVGFAKVTRDISEKMALEAAKDELLAFHRAERERVELRLRQIENELVQGYRVTVLGEMASTLAHEINQPLTSVVNYLRGGVRLIDQDGIVDLKLVRHALDQACGEALRAGEIIRHVREFVSKGTIVKRPENLHRVIREACEIVLIDQQHPEVNISLRLNDEVDEVPVDRIQIQQVMLNLIRNAIDARVGSSSAALSILTGPAQQPEYVQISVTDAGTGLDPALASRLFNTFVTSKSNGMGMGLSICRTIVESHGGKIWAQPNREGPGAEFHFTLPLHAAA